jgi:hypothetical protein
LERVLSGVSGIKLTELNLISLIFVRLTML